jgi:hypothetical protein
MTTPARLNMVAARPVDRPSPSCAPPRQSLIRRNQVHDTPLRAGLRAARAAVPAGCGSNTDTPGARTARSASIAGANAHGYVVPGADPRHVSGHAGDTPLGSGAEFGSAALGRGGFEPPSDGL